MWLWSVTQRPVMISIDITRHDLLIRDHPDPVPEVSKADTALFGRDHWLEDSIALIQQVFACGRITGAETLCLL